MENKVLHNDHLNRDYSDPGNKIPITVVEAVYRDPDDRTIILLRETAVISGHNIPSDQLEKIKEVLRSKLKQKYLEGIHNESIRRTVRI